LIPVLNYSILLREGNKESLCDFTKRIELHSGLGESQNSIMIDKIHRAMHLFEGERKPLLDYLSIVAQSADSEFWRVLTALTEVLPKGIKDFANASGLITSKDSLMRESRQFVQIQETLDF
jgi:hypothetical protein